MTFGSVISWERELDPLPPEPRVLDPAERGDALAAVIDY